MNLVYQAIGRWFVYYVITNAAITVAKEYVAMTKTPETPETDPTN